MNEPLKVVTWASIKGHCPIRYSVHSDDDVVFTFDNEFELALNRCALRNLLEAGSEVQSTLAAYIAGDDELQHPAVVRSPA